MLARPKPLTYDAVVERLCRAFTSLRARVGETPWSVAGARRLTGLFKEDVQRPSDPPMTKLARAIGALRLTVSALRSLDDLDSFLAEVLKRMAEQVGAASAAVFVVDEDQQVRLTWVVEDGRLVRGAESRHPNATRPLGFADYTSHLKSAEHRTGVPRITSGTLGHNEHGRVYLEEMGVKSVVAIPVLLDDVAIASFHLRLHSDGRPADEDLQIAQALADQTALAFRLTRLAGRARAAALAQQAEQAARQRAESQARLADASRRTLERLAVSADPDAFLGHVLTVAAEQLGAFEGSVWRVEGRRADLAVSLEDGVIRRGNDSRLPFSVIEGEDIDPILARGRELGMDDPHDFATRSEYARFKGYLALKGIKCMLRVPLFLGDEYRGCMLLRFAISRRLSPEEVELAQTFGNQAVLAIELARLTQSARAAAVSGERSRLARDIHDTLAQGLAAIILHLETAASAGASPQIIPHITAATELARESLIEARRSIRALRPAGLDGRTLEGALSEVTGRLARLSQATFRVRTWGAPGRLPAEVEAALLRIVSEAMTNAARHAQACTIDVELTYEHPAVRVVVRDDGIGFDAAAVGRRNVGLSSMRERAHAIGAAITIASEPRAGTEVLVYWSVSAAHAVMS
ncbi:MAG TPA: GAF domain-containing protein [Polyangia bacterium]|nr:GAF domain-containing protein [Polyangia bacterium]